MPAWTDQRTGEAAEDYRRVERSYGSFRRVVTLPLPVEEERIQAKYADGVLHVTLPKTARAKPKTIEVRGG